MHTPHRSADARHCHKKIKGVVLAQGTSNSIMTNGIVLLR